MSSVPPPPPIHQAFVTTLPEVPGYPTVRPLGVVVGIGTGSGRTARGKATTAYIEALEQLTQAGASFGGNAVVGVNISNFGSSLGGALGDAVGVVLLGTAVVIATV